MNKTKIMAGLDDNAVEFFAVPGDIKCTNNEQVYRYKNFPKWIIDTIQADMESNPEALKALGKWENLAPEDYIRQYIQCNFGGVDNEPDIDVNGKINHTEFFDCGFRGTCKHEGKLCRAIKVKNGYLTKTEIKIMQNICHPAKIIADTLCISEQTVNSHIQNIMQKTELGSKAELVDAANKLGII